MSDYNLFPEDVCLAMKKKMLEPKIMVTENNIEREIPVLYIYPESSLEQLQIPSLVLFEVDPIPDRQRREAGSRLLDNFVYDEETEELINVDVRVHPEPFILYIYFRLKYKYDQHRDTVRNEIYKRFSVPFGSVEVNGYFLPVFFRKEIPNLTSLNEEVELREYKVAQWQFRVPTWFDIHARKTMDIVRDVIVNDPEILS